MRNTENYKNHEKSKNCVFLDPRANAGVIWSLQDRP